MKKIFFSLSVCCVLAACSSKPETYKCINEADSKDIQSLSIGNGTAILGFTTLNAQCHVNGNNTVYSKNSEDCKKIGGDSPYVNLVFDKVIFRAVYNESSPTGVSGQQIYSCTKL